MAKELFFILMAGPMKEVSFMTSNKAKVSNTWLMVPCTKDRSTKGLRKAKECSSGRMVKCMMGSGLEERETGAGCGKAQKGIHIWGSGKMG